MGAAALTLYKASPFKGILRWPGLGSPLHKFSSCVSVVVKSEEDLSWIPYVIDACCWVRRHGRGVSQILWECSLSLSLNHQANIIKKPTQS
jgi:hypothetical protein